MKMRSSKLSSRVAIGACPFWKAGGEHCILLSGRNYKFLVIRRSANVL